jgi:hypothetical protein
MQHNKILITCSVSKLGIILIQSKLLISCCVSKLGIILIHNKIYATRQVFIAVQITVFTHTWDLLSLNLLKTKFLLSKARKFILYPPGNTLHLRYKDQPVNAIRESLSYCENCMKYTATLCGQNKEFLYKSFIGVKSCLGQLSSLRFFMGFLIPSMKMSG